MLLTVNATTMVLTGLSASVVVGGITYNNPLSGSKRALHIHDCPIAYSVHSRTVVLQSLL